MLCSFVPVGVFFARQRWFCETVWLEVNKKNSETETNAYCIVIRIENVPAACFLCVHL